MLLGQPKLASLTPLILFSLPCRVGGPKIISRSHDIRSNVTIILASPRPTRIKKTFRAVEPNL